MRFFFYQHNQVARRAATFAGITTPLYIHLHAFAHAGGYINSNGFFAVHPAITAAGRTFCCDGGAFAVAGRTGSNGLHLSEESILHTTHLAGTMAGATGLNAAFIFCAAAIAGAAHHVFLHLDLLGNAPRDFFVIQFDLDAQVAAAHTTRALSAAASAATAKEASEDVVAKISPNWLKISFMFTLPCPTLPFTPA